MESKVVTTLMVRDRKFYIVHHQEHYCAIEDKYLDENMCLTQRLNGLQMFAKKKLPDCINAVTQAVEVEHLVEKEGYELQDALNKVYVL